MKGQYLEKFFLCKRISRPGGRKILQNPKKQKRLGGFPGPLGPPPRTSRAASHPLPGPPKNSPFRTATDAPYYNWKADPITTGPKKHKTGPYCSQTPGHVIVKVFRWLLSGWYWKTLGMALWKYCWNCALFVLLEWRPASAVGTATGKCCWNGGLQVLFDFGRLLEWCSWSAPGMVSNNPRMLLSCAPWATQIVTIVLHLQSLNPTPRHRTTGGLCFLAHNEMSTSLLAACALKFGNNHI